MINMMRMQHTLDVWGPDRLDFRPSRFTDRDDSHPENDQARKRHFFPWSRGPRQCPGMKIAQVEFVALVAAVLSRARLECARQPGETLEKAKERTLRVLKDSSPLLAMQVNRPKDVVVLWKERV